MTTDVTLLDISDLLENFAKNVYRAKNSDQGSPNHEVMQKCLALFKLDYNTIEIGNPSGELSSHYPNLIVIPENEKHAPNAFANIQQTATASNGSVTPPPPSLSPANGLQTNTLFTQRAQHQQATIYENSYDPRRLRDLMIKARLARSRTRFPVPVILYKGKFVCRSSTLSSGPELYTRSSIDYFFSSTTTDDVDHSRQDEDGVEMNESFTEDQTDECKTNWPLFDQIRNQDIRLLKMLNVGTIVDFMVEKKKVKFGLKVTSSEKVDKENRYADFTVISLPYPGCEFFREFRDNNYTHDKLVFDWSQTHVNADITIPLDTITSQLLHIEWDQYRLWDLVTITQNYLKLCLKYLQDNSSGILIHCISGWDRTPLFISLLRMSLWADGVIHQSLNVQQIIFLTVAYDWFLFGHDLPDRLTKGEDIFVFCFYALKYIVEEEFSVIGHRHRSKHSSSGSSSVVIIPPDMESLNESLQCDGDSRGSSVSLSSGGSQNDVLHNRSFSKDDQESTNGNSFASAILNQDSNSSIEILPDPPNNVNSFSPLAKRKTSPMSVPYSSRQRNESTSSVGSWQMVNQSGSLRSTDSGNLLHNMRTHSSNLQESGSTLVDDDIFTTNQNIYSRRKERINSLRGVFYGCYGKAVGFKYNNGDGGVGKVFGSIAESVQYYLQRT